MTEPERRGSAGIPRPFDGTSFEDESADGWPESVADDRRRGRAVAVQVLYEVDLTRHEAASVLERRLVDDATPLAAARVARALVADVVARHKEIDDALEECAPQWPIDRVDPVERAILRVATSELLRDRTADERGGGDGPVPVRVAINEAVELARLFGHDPSTRFVNGVLGAIARRFAPAVALAGLGETGPGAGVEGAAAEVVDEVLSDPGGDGDPAATGFATDRRDG